MVAVFKNKPMFRHRPFRRRPADDQNLRIPQANDYENAYDQQREAELETRTLRNGSRAATSQRYD